MSYMVNRLAPAVVIALAALLLISGCSNSGNAREKANEAVARANKSIAEHNRLFEQSRSTYSDVKARLESGGDPSRQKSSIEKAGSTLEKARTSLKNARKPLEEVQGLDVNEAVKKYTRLLTQAMNAQISAEGKEVKFYGILEKDPTLKNNRKQADELLSEISKGYEKSRKSYEKARDFARSHPNVITLPPNASGGTTSGGMSTSGGTTAMPSTTSPTVGGTT